MPLESPCLRGVGRDGKPHRRLCLDGMEQEHECFATDRTRARADLPVNGHPSEDHDPHNDVVVFAR